MVLDGVLVLLVGAVEVTATVTLPFADRPGRGLLIALTVAGAASLILRRSHPVAVALVTLVFNVLAGLTGPGNAATLSSVIGLYSLGRHAAGRPVWIIAGATSLIYVVSPLIYAAVHRLEPAELLRGASVPALFPLLITGVGQFLRLRGELRERRRQQAADAAVRAERRRIARELHDVVAHHISVINVMVGAGRTTMAADPERAQEALVTAERTAREAMAEMRQLLHVLRAEDGDEPENHAGVGAAALPDLVSRVDGAGPPVGLEVTGDAVPLPAAVDHAVYRIAQEALTNTRKHADGARVSVRLAYLPGAVEVEVLDDGLGHRGGATQAGTGFGLGGMAERVALCGGQLQTGPRPGGGFRVHARIPVPAVPDAAPPKEGQ
ncbi:two-component sensor histidine kinase [Planobispora siamensis]|uniref:histidine kinase n=2 Tax=Planobispora siamensis TaxID=936338 RepID=A0A8J3SJS7_9ACTN|nr:two-component sensor histidine kinase [Planobispora siamensis]